MRYPDAVWLDQEDRLREAQTVVERGKRAARVDMDREGLLLELADKLTELAEYAREVATEECPACGGGGKTTHGGQQAECWGCAGEGSVPHTEADAIRAIVGMQPAHRSGG